MTPKELITEIFNRGYSGSIEDLDDVIVEYLPKILVVEEKIEKFKKINHCSYERFNRSAGTTYYVDDEDRYHRVDGPAIIHKNGSVCWYIHGKLHREGGPAIEDKEGFHQWWLNGIQYPYRDYIELKNKFSMDDISI